MDVTPAIPKGKNIIKGYGNMAFKINDAEHKTSLLVFPDKLVVWPVSSHEEFSLEAFTAIIENDLVEILLIGCGETHVPLAPEIQRHFQKANIGVEIMTTGAACRTYNVLLSEGRNVAAALILV